MDNSDFYTNLPYVNSFENFHKLELYRDVPYNWFIVTTDIKGSTKLTDAGKFNQISFISSLCLLGVLEEINDIDIPFSYGGDGITFLIPPKYLERVSKTLTFAIYFAKERFNIDLIAGIVPITEVLRHRHKVKVLKIKLDEGLYHPVFSGGGMSFAEKLIKTSEEFRLRDVIPSFPDIDFINFISSDISAEQSDIISLLVKTSESVDEGQTYNEVLNVIRMIFGTETNRKKYNTKRSTRLKKIHEKIVLNTKFQLYKNRQKDKVSFLKHYFHNSKKYIHERYSSNSEEFNSDAFKNSDMEKFDDMLRMTLVGNLTQKQQLEAFLYRLYEDKKLAYGLSINNNAYLTLRLKRNKQNYFLIDGSNAGYTQAAKELKNRLNWLSIT